MKFIAGVVADVADRYARWSGVGSLMKPSFFSLSAL